MRLPQWPPGAVSSQESQKWETGEHRKKFDKMMAKEPRTLTVAATLTSRIISLKGMSWTYSARTDILPKQKVGTMMARELYVNCDGVGSSC